MTVIKICILARVNAEIYAQATLRASVSTRDYGIVRGEHHGRFKHPSLFAPSSECTELARRIESNSYTLQRRRCRRVYMPTVIKLINLALV